MRDKEDARNMMRTFIKAASISMCKIGHRSIVRTVQKLAIETDFVKSSNRQSSEHTNYHNTESTFVQLGTKEHSMVLRPGLTDLSPLLVLVAHSFNAIHAKEG